LPSKPKNAISSINSSRLSHFPPVDPDPILNGSFAMTEFIESFRIGCDNPRLQAGVVVARRVTIAPSPPALVEEIRQLVNRIRESGSSESDRIRRHIRDLLRAGGYKPSGRGRPASEYLSNAALRNEFPLISTVVDINNLLSLESGLPGSLLDLDRIGSRLVIRNGRPGESYVFNQSGQSIDLEGLLCVCGDDGGGTGQPFGNPVKDSMSAKTTAETRNVIGVVFSHREALSADQLESLMRRFAHLLEHYAGAAESSWRLYPSS
jgi:DNA/RNA-binding domain of Phe-tRNA-synthetase-like protein